MNKTTLKNVIIGLLLVIIILLVLLYLYNSRNTSTPSNTAIATSAGYSTIVKNAPPVILDSPYLYDSGYWVSPNAWWMSPDDGNTFVRNNYKTNYNYYYDKHTGANKPVPTTTAASLEMHPQPNPTPSATMGIQNILPTGQLISPNQDSAFPLPTLAASGEMVPPVDMPNRQLPDLVRSNNISPAVMADSMAAKVDMQASQLLGIRGGNNPLELTEPKVS